MLVLSLVLTSVKFITVKVFTEVTKPHEEVSSKHIFFPRVNNIWLLHHT